MDMNRQEPNAHPDTAPDQALSSEPPPHPAASSLSHAGGPEHSGSRDETFTAATDRFLAAAPWLTDEHAPAVIALRMLALELDTGKFQAATVSQYGLTYRSLLKAKPADTGPVDGLEAFLAGADE